MDRALLHSPAARVQVAARARRQRSVYLLAGRLTDLSLSHQWPFVALAGGGIG
jgi:hypothetical protein